MHGATEVTCQQTQTPLDTISCHAADVLWADLTHLRHEAVGALAGHRWRCRAPAEGAQCMSYLRCVYLIAHLCLCCKHGHILLQPVLLQSLCEEPELLCADFLVHIINNTLAKGWYVEVVYLQKTEKQQCRLKRPSRPLLEGTFAVSAVVKAPLVG